MRSSCAVTLPDLSPLFRVGETIIKSEAAAMHRQWLQTRPQDYSNGVRLRIEGGLFLPATDYIDALRLRGVMTAKFIAETMMGIDLLHLPASAYLPPTVDESDMESSSSETLLGLFSKLTQFMRPFNFLGCRRSACHAASRLADCRSHISLSATRLPKPPCCMRLTSISARPTIIALFRRCDPFSARPRESGTQSQEKKELDSRFRGNERARLQALLPGTTPAFSPAQ